METIVWSCIELTGEAASCLFSLMYVFILREDDEPSNRNNGIYITLDVDVVILCSNYITQQADVIDNLLVIIYMQ